MTVARSGRAEDTEHWAARNAPSLSDIRAKIDAIDAQLLELLNERLEAAKLVGEIKRSQSAPIVDPAREREVVDRLVRLNPGPMRTSTLEHLYSLIITESRDCQVPR